MILEEGSKGYIEDKKKKTGRKEEGGKDGKRAADLTIETHAPRTMPRNNRRTPSIEKKARNADMWSPQWGSQKTGDIVVNKSLARRSKGSTRGGRGNH